jgi:hypothetical protein
MWEAIVRAVGDLDSVLGFEVRCIIVDSALFVHASCS